jgi:hypothetical protein
MKSLKRLFLFSIAIAGLLWVFGFFTPDPKIIITRQLRKLTELASFTSSEPSFQRFGKVKQMGKLFSEDVIIVADYAELENHTLKGRDELMQAMMAAKPFGSGLSVEFIDINIELGSEKKSALVDVTLKGRFGGDTELIAQELSITFKRIKGEWLITRAETVHTLKP